MNAKDWWEYYLEGKMVRREDTPVSVIRTLEDWADATLADEKDPMWQFTKGKPVNPRKLQKAIRECIHSNQLGIKEQKKLLDLEVWAIRETALAEAAKALRDAEKDLYEAASVAGLDDYHTYKIATGPGG
jgi:hypothetical protein